jgi:hypothetical protein
MELANWRLPILALNEPGDLEPDMHRLYDNVDVVRRAHTGQPDIGLCSKTKRSKERCGAFLVIFPAAIHAST